MRKAWIPGFGLLLRFRVQRKCNAGRNVGRAVHGCRVRV